VFADGFPIGSCIVRKPDRASRGADGTLGLYAAPHRTHRRISVSSSTDNRLDPFLVAAVCSE
jgi:hypothetical protein